MTGVSVLCGAVTPDGPCALPQHRRGWHDARPSVLRVPRNRDGHYQVSISQLRRYGAVDLLDEHAETVRGCPRAYALTYGGDPVPELPAQAAELGSALHRALQWMEVHTCGPEEALGAVWAPTLGLGAFEDAIDILLGYLDRGGPMTRYATLATELDIAAPLYVDDEHGPVWFRGILDNISIDPHDPEIVRVIDHKSSARPVPADALRGDAQLRAYVWLVRQWWRQQYGTEPDRVVAHLDLLRFRDIPIEYTDHELEVWQEWASAMVRTMLRDTAPAPILNDGCGTCAVRWGCPAWRALPGEGRSMLARMAGRTVEELTEHYADAEQVASLLGTQLKQLKAVLDTETHTVGTLQVGDELWTSTPGTKTAADVLSLVDLLLPDYPSAFETAVTSSRAAVERAARGLDPELRSQILGCVSQVQAGRKVTRKKTGVGDGSQSV